MPLVESSLGYVLLHIYEFPFEGAIYLPAVGRASAYQKSLNSQDFGEEIGVHHAA